VWPNQIASRSLAGDGAHAQLQVLVGHQALLADLHLVAEHRRLEALAPHLGVQQWPPSRR
jgi:hypothetical protein